MNKLQTSGQCCQAATFETQSSTVLEGATDLISATIGQIATWHQRWQQRHQLAQLDGRLLRDIGLDPYEAQQEMRKPFWIE